MFTSARLQLTAWYLLIIMIISSVFSVVIYSSIDSELVRIERFQQTRIERVQRMLREMPVPPDLPPFELSDIAEARKRVIFTLLVINVGILALSGGAGYFLAGRTLKPIQETLESQKQFISDASHELRTPLTSLRTELEVSLRDKRLSLPQAKKLLQSNLEDVIQLQSLSDGLLTLARNEQGHRGSKEVVMLDEVITESIRRVTALAKEKKIHLASRLQRTTLVGNEQALVELFVILLDNAIKYSPEKSKVTIQLMTYSKKVRVDVIDNGIGIDPKDLPHIFDRFYRSDKARTHKDASGYGLGLAIAQKIVSEHKGYLAVTSGRGTTFTVTLPRATAHQ